MSDFVRSIPEMTAQANDVRCITITGEDGLVLLVYGNDLATAPEILWSGQGEQAQRMRFWAKELGFPTLDDATLVDSLLGQQGEIPENVYQRVAAHFARADKQVARVETAPLPSVNPVRIRATHDVVLPDGDWVRIRRICAAYVDGFDREMSGALCFLFTGPTGTGKTSLAFAVAKLLGREASLHSPADIPRRLVDETLEQIFESASKFRKAIILDEAEQISEQSSPEKLLSLLDQCSVPVIFTCQGARVNESLARRCIVRHQMAKPDATLRRRIWDVHLNSLACAGDLNVGRLAREYEMTGGMIASVILEARFHARLASGGVLTQSLLEASALAQLPKADSDAVASETKPRARLDDLVLKPELRDQLRELSGAMRNRDEIAARLGYFGHSLAGGGITALFAGPSGTGKTHSAEAMAGEACMRFQLVRWSDFFAKYLGETESRINAFFDSMRDDVLYFFDEAEGLLFHRAGAERSWEFSFSDLLLRRIEETTSAMIFATNLTDRMDAAFERRILYRLRFSEPDETERAEMLRRVARPLGCSVDEDQIHKIARRMAFTGGTLSTALRRAVCGCKPGERLINLDDIEAELEKSGQLSLGMHTRAVGF